MARAYRIETERKYEMMLRRITDLFPEYCKSFFDYLRLNNEIRSCYSYAEDIKIFFEYLLSQNSQYGETIKEIPLEILDRLVPTDFYEYMTYLSYYTDKAGNVHTNNDVSKKHKINSLKVFYNYFYNNKFIQNNPTQGLRIKKPNTKEVIVLNYDEVHTLLSYVEGLGVKLQAELNSGVQNKSLSQRYHYFQKNRYRDKALLMVFLGTGIRVSECVGLDITDIDFKTNSLKVIRKGGNEDHVYFNREVADVLQDYIDLERSVRENQATDKTILFYSSRNTRMGVRAVEKMVKKYVTEALPGRADEISVHKLRSTFATNAYIETRDIHAISKALGHSSLAMVGKYAKAGDDDKKRISESIKFQ